MNNPHDIPWRKANYCYFQEQQLTSLDKENRIQFCKAIQRRDIQSVQHFIQNGVSVNNSIRPSKFDPYQTPLHLAVISRCPEIVKILLDNGAKTNSRTVKHESPLIMAAKTQNSSLIDLLLMNESTNSWDCHDLSHLHIACMRGNLIVAKRILLEDEGEHLNTPVDESSMYWPGFTPLHFAVHFEQFETVQFLLKNGADLMKQDPRQLTPLHLAHLQRHEEIIDLLLSAHKYYFLNPTNAQGTSHFHIACSRDDTSVVEHFLEFGSNVDSENEDGWRPIHFALYYDCPHVVNLLSETKIYLGLYKVPRILKQTYILQNHILHSLSLAERTISDNSREMSPQLLEFYNSCINNDADKLEHLLSIGVVGNDFDLNMSLSNGCTPLHLAVRSKAEETAIVLLNHGANYMLQDAEGKTALHIALDWKLKKVLDKMFTNFNNLTPNLIDNNGLSVFHILCTRDEPRAIEDFLGRGVNINSQVGSESAFWAGFTPIHFAIRYKKHHVIDILLRHGADISITTELGFDSLAFAFERLHQVMDPNKYIILGIINLILKFGKNELENFNDRGISPFHVTCMECDDDPNILQQYLTSHRDYINKPIEFPNKFPMKYFYNDRTPLALVLINQHFHQALLLIENGADLSRVNDEGEDLIQCAFIQGWYQRKLMDKAENFFNIAIASMEKLKPTYFYKACTSGLTNVVKSILENCIDEKLKAKIVSYRNDVGQTPLHALLLRQISEVEAERFRREQIVKSLIKHGSDVNARDYMLRTPLHCVERETDLDVTRLLLEHGADVNAQNVLGQTPLHQMYVEFFEGYDRNIFDPLSFRHQIILLLESGFDIDIIDELGRTCLMIADSLLRTNQAEDDDADDPVELDLARLLLEHVRKLQIIGLDIRQKNQQAFRSLKHKDTTYNESVFDERCHQELDLMKSVRLDRRITMFHILTENLDNMAYYCENTILQDVVESNDFVRFSNYGFLIKLQIKNGRARRSLLKKSEEILKCLIDKSLPRECLEKILRYLTNLELENVISSSTDSIHDDKLPE